MSGSPKTFVIPRPVVTLCLAIGVFLMASVVVAAIVTGTSSINTSNNVAITQVSIGVPAGVVEGDLLIANIAMNGGFSETITAPQDWHLIAKTDNGRNLSIASYWKIAGASEGVSTWTISPQTRAVGGITRYSGVDTSDPIDSFSENTGRGTSATALSVPATNADSKLLALYAINQPTNNSTNFNVSVGMTSQYSNAKNPPLGPTAALFDMDVAAGPTGDKVSVFSKLLPRDWVAQLIVLRPAEEAPVLSSIDLERDNTQYLQIDDASAPALDITGDITVEAWVKFESLPQTEGGNSAYLIASKYNEPSSSDHAWNFGVQVIGGQLYIGFEHRDDTGDSDNHSRYKLQYNFQTGAWYHIAVVVEAVNAMGTFYINGAQYTPPPISQNATSILNSAAPFRIGAIGVGGQPVQFFDGLIDEVRVWNIQRTAAEVNADMSSELTGTESGLVGYWKLNNSLDSTPSGYTLSNPNDAEFSTGKPF